MRYIATAFLTERMAFMSYDADATFGVSLAYEGEGRESSQVCEDMFHDLNKDTRPNRFMQRSMCVGDAVRIDFEDGTVEWWGCESIGFRPVNPPTQFTDKNSEYMATRPSVYNHVW